MDVTPVLLTEITALVQGADAVTSMSAQLDRMAAALTHAVPSVLAFRIVVMAGHEPITLDLVDANRQGPVLSSLAIPLGPTVGAVGGWMIIYAGAAGSLVDLAADLEFELGVPGVIAVDHHLTSRPERSALRGVDLVAQSNLALGVLIGRGLLPEEASAEMDRRAAVPGGSRAAAARSVVQELGGPAVVTVSEENCSG